jgi:transglutaminase-like putative cysteine protease
MARRLSMPRTIADISSFEAHPMLIRYGYQITIACPQYTAIVARLSVHPEREGDVIYELPFHAAPMVQSSVFVDEFGSRARRFLAPAGKISLQADGLIADSGQLDDVNFGAAEVPIMALPADAMQFLLGSRYCETDLLGALAWQMFGGCAPGWGRVQAICDFVHGHLTFSYPHARSTRTAFEAYQERIGVCRDFTHLAITLCRCMNIPARYVNGYLGDIGVPADPAPMDFSAWFEVYLGDRWYTFDARHNTRRTGRIVIARGRDAMDVPMIHSFGPHILESFRVMTVEVTDARASREMDAQSWQEILPRISLAA